MEVRFLSRAHCSEAYREASTKPYFENRKITPVGSWELLDSWLKGADGIVTRCYNRKNTDMWSFINSLSNSILQALDHRPRVRVLVHEAFFDNNPEPFYFVKVANCSPENIFTITHVWAKDGVKEIDIINPERILPKKLTASEVWETWFSKKIIHNQVEVFDNVYVELSNGKSVRSKKNVSVRPRGFVAR